MLVYVDECCMWWPHLTLGQVSALEWGNQPDEHASVHTCFWTHDIVRSFKGHIYGWRPNM